MRYRMELEYDGGNYAGWQVQKNADTVQGTVERAMCIVLRQAVKITGSGRTDAGVHALAQVAHFDHETNLNGYQLAHSLNGVLPADIRIHFIEPVDSKFHARYDAIRREYKYQIATRPNALQRNTSWYVPVEIDESRMRLATKDIIGEHDFQSFCKTIAEVDHYKCTVFKAEWVRQEGMLIFSIVANRFLHGMVRALVGTMYDIGRQHTEVNQIPEILMKKNRKYAGPAAPARGLVLHKITY